MAEALFAKYSKSGMSISNDVKISLGLKNNATLDDVLNRIASGAGIELIDPYNVPFEVSLLHYNAQPVVSSPVQVTFPDGSNKTYNTDRNGIVRFVSPPGNVYINDMNCNYFDMLPDNKFIQDCEIGQNWNNVTMLRQTRFSNGASYTFTKNENIVISNAIDSYDVEIKGADGQSTTPFLQVMVWQYDYRFNSQYNTIGYEHAYNAMTIRYGWADPQRRSSVATEINLIANQNIQWGDFNWFYSYANDTNWETKLFPKPGFNGEWGNLIKINNYKMTGAVNVRVGTIGQDLIWWKNDTTNFINGADTYKFHQPTNDSAFRRNNGGKTGGSTSFFSYTANGGRGGNEIGTNNLIGPECSNKLMVRGSMQFCWNNGMSMPWGIRNNNSYSVCNYSFGAYRSQNAKNGYVKLTNIQYK